MPLQSWQRALDLAAALDPELEGLARKRRGHILFLLVAVPTTCVLAAIVVHPFLNVIFEKPAHYALTAALAGGFLVSCALYPHFDADYRRKAKRVLSYKIARILGMKYYPNGMFRVGAVYDHYLFPAYNVDRVQDGFVFNVADRRVEMIEAQLLRTYNDETISLRNLLPCSERGLIIRIESRKTQPFHTVVIPRNFWRGKHHRSHFMGMHHYERTPFGNRSFSTRYDVLSEDHTDAHDIFDPAFIEKFLEFEKAVSAKSLSVSFKKREIVFYARNGHDLFEPGGLARAVSVRSLQEIFRELQSLDDLIEVLKLNPYVGL